jgi:hypothetical protein
MSDGLLFSIDVYRFVTQGFGVAVTPRNSVTNRASGPIWPNSDAHGIAKKGASK